MKKSFQIFKRDLGRLFRNRAAVLILVGISVLPSLYAWFNIAANMDPYGNTKGGCVDEEIISDFQKRSWPVVP